MILDTVWHIEKGGAGEGTSEEVQPFAATLGIMVAEVMEASKPQPVVLVYVVCLHDD